MSQMLIQPGPRTAILRNSEEKSASTARHGLLFRGIVSNWLVLVVTASSSLVLTPIVIRELGEFYFGMWVLVMSVIEHYGLLNIGFGSALPRFVALYRGGNQRQRLNQTLATGLSFGVVAGTAVLGLTWIFLGILPDFFEIRGPERETFSHVLLLLGLTTAVAFPERMLGGYLAGFQRYDLINLVAITKEILRLVILLILMHAGFGVVAMALLTLGLTASSFVAHYSLTRWVDQQLSVGWRYASRQCFREMLNFSIYIFFGAIADQIRFRLDAIVISRLLGMALVTPFAVASRFMDYFLGFVTGITKPLMPRFAELRGQANHEEFNRLFLRSVKATALISIFIGSLCIFNGQSFLTLWLGETFRHQVVSYQVLAILTLAYVVALAQSPSVVALYATARHRPMALWLWAEAIANLGLSIYWAPRYGIIGVAMGTVVPMIFVKVLIQPWYTLRVLGLTARCYVSRGLARPLLVGSVFVAVCQARTSPVDSFLALGLTVAWQTALFAVLTLFIGITTAERKEYGAVVREWRVLSIERGRLFWGKDRHASA